MIYNLLKTCLIIFSCLHLHFLPAQNLQRADSLELLLKTTDSPIEKIETALKLATELKYSNPGKALDYANIAYELSESENYDKGILNSIISKANIYWSITDFKTAMEFADKATEMAEELKMQKELALSLRITGLIYIELSDYEKSTEYFFEALRLFEQINDKEGKSKLLSDIGSVYFHQYNYNKALEYYFQSLNIAKEIVDKMGIARGLNNIAAVYEAMKDYEKAGRYFQEASVINRELGNKLWEGINYLNLGTVKLNLKDYDESLQRFRQALAVFTGLQSKILQAKCHLNLANYFIETNEPEQALEYSKLALKEGQAQNLKQIIHDAAEIIQKIYLQKGDKENAYKYVVLQYQMKDSLVLMENRAELANLELQYKFDKKEQAKHIEQQRKDLFVLIVVISLLIALIVIILILARLSVKAKNGLLKQQKLEHQLEFRNKELAANVMSLMKKNEVLSAISDKLITIKNYAVKEETKDAINKISKEIQKTTEEEIFEEFELRFNQVHSDFYEKLLQRFPELSPSEHRLCAFLRLNMTTKEISELTGQQVSSLETARYRLRKKLGITNSQTNLITFLSNI